ncbi:putative tail fiber protein [Methylophilales phage MEP402]|nr:putative tail fiber protein [Methylophilales phage MEP402]
MADIVLNGDTSGAITIAAPAVAGTNTLTLPAETGTVALTSGAGKILQVVQGTHSTNVTNSSNTYADTGLTASITPSSTSNKILVMVSHSQCNKTADNSQNALGIKLFRGSTEIYYPTSLSGYGNLAQGTIFEVSFNYLDTPSTTSATTYKTQFANEGNNGAAVGVQSSSKTSTMILMEVAA